MRDAAPHPANPLKRVGAQTLLRKTAFCGGYFQEFGNQKKPCAFRLQKYPVFSRAFVRLTEGARDNVPCRVRDRVPYSAAFFRKKADYAASVEQEISGNLFSCFDYGSGWPSPFLRLCFGRCFLPSCWSRLSVFFSGSMKNAALCAAAAVSTAAGQGRHLPIFPFCCF